MDYEELLSDDTPPLSPLGKELGHYRGYKGLSVELEDDLSPVLMSPVYRYKWTPGIQEEVAKGYDSAGSGGFYALTSPKAVLEQGYWTPGKWPGVLVELLPYGKGKVGRKGGEIAGFRTEKALLTGIVQDTYTCEGCEAAPGTVLLTKRSGSTSVLLCDKCNQKLKKTKLQLNVKETDASGLFHKLSTRYNVPLLGGFKLGEMKWI